MSTYRVELLVRQMVKDVVVALYVSQDLQLPFVPAVGMQFKQGISTWLWETDNGELMPGIETVTYDFDEEVFVCLFTVEKPLNSAFWTKIEGTGIEKSTYPAYYKTRS
jgi:hypothetical protein